jgi:hydroxymethylbilane synthase
MIRIGTRGSRLALAQAKEIASLLEELGEEATLVPIVTAGDRGASARSSPAGVKGLFVAEIVRALQRGEVDLAVHSAKDLPSEDPDGVVVAAVPARRAPHDVLVTRDGALPPGSVVGTSSLRRKAQFLRANPGTGVTDLRGNVDTRLRKLEEGVVDGIILAAAGLERLGLQPSQTSPIPTEEMVPAPGQGALAVQARHDAIAEVVARLEDAPSRRAFEAERRLVQLLGGGCRLPLGALAVSSDGRVQLEAVVIKPDGSKLLRARAEAEDPVEAARDSAEELLRAGARKILEEAS